jgi:CheY-like chemotaxis protein
MLVVDDNHDSAKSLAMLLRLAGNDVQMAFDGEEAVDVATKTHPEVILLDIGLPKLNGYDACRRIREEASGREAVIIALTGWGQAEDRRKSSEAGFDGHLVKPVEHSALLAMLKQLLGTKKA